jgi:hypothetical protein
MTAGAGVAVGEGVAVGKGSGVAVGKGRALVGVRVRVASESSGVTQGFAVGVKVRSWVGDVVQVGEGVIVGDGRWVGVLLAVGRGVQGRGVGGVAGNVGTNRSAIVAVGSKVGRTAVDGSLRE